MLHWYCVAQPMANLTLTIDDETLRRARIRALKSGTSVNALVRGYLETYAGERSTREAMRRFLAATEELDAGSGAEGRSWTREDLYRDRFRRDVER